MILFDKHCLYSLNGIEYFLTWIFIAIRVKIIEGGPTTPPPTKSPSSTSAPSIINPVTPSPTGTNGCCSRNYKTCDATWCGDTKEKCLACGSAGDKTWLPNGALTSSCIQRDGDCTGDVDGCCNEGVGLATLECSGNEWYRQCVTAPISSPTTSAPSASPTQSVTNSPSMEPSIDCSSITDKKQCNRTNGCSFFRKDEECRVALTTDECSSFDGKAQKCKKNGCKWNKTTKICKGRWD